MIPDAVDCALAGVRAVDPFDIVAAAIGERSRGNGRDVGTDSSGMPATSSHAIHSNTTNTTHRRDAHDPLAAASIAVVAVGKAAAAMARGAQFALGARISRGIVVAPTPGHVPGAWETYVGGHPIPNEEGATGARAIRALSGASAAATGP